MLLPQKPNCDVGSLYLEVRDLRAVELRRPFVFTSRLATGLSSFIACYPKPILNALTESYRIKSLTLEE